MTYFYAFQKLRASDLQKTLSLNVVKTTTETVTSSTTMQNDDELFLSVAANTSYAVTAKLIIQEITANSADIAIRWLFPTNALFDMACVGPHENWVSTAGSALETEWVAWQGETTGTSSTKKFGTHTTVFSINGSGTLRVGNTAGTFRLQWAQGTSSASTTRLLAGSALELRPMLG